MEDQKIQNPVEYNPSEHGNNLNKLHEDITERENNVVNLYMVLETKSHVRSLKTEFYKGRKSFL